MKNPTFRFAVCLAVGVVLGSASVYWWLTHYSPQVSPVAASSSVAPAAPQAPADEEAIGVEITFVEQAMLAHSVAAVGSLSSEDSVMLRPEITGRISAINFEE